MNKKEINAKENENNIKLKNTKEAVIPTNDFVFKRIFGRVGNENITKSLLSSIINDKIKTVNLEGNSILEGDILTDKLSVLDIRAVLNGNIEVDIEMQIVSQNYIEERLLYYWAKLYTRTVTKGEFYESAKRTIAILIADFELEKLKGIEEYHTQWKIKETEFYEKVLTDKFEIDIIELPKAKRYIEKELKNRNENKELETWIKFLINPESLGVAEMEENEEIKNAKEELEKIKQDERESWKAEMRLKYIRDEHARIQYATEKGLKEGLERGIEQGAKSKQLEIAKKC